MFRQNLSKWNINQTRSFHHNYILFIKVKIIHLVFCSLLSVKITFIFWQLLNDWLLVVLKSHHHFKRVCRLCLTFFIFKHHYDVDLGSWIRIKVFWKIALNFETLVGLNNYIDIELIVCLKVFDLVSNQRFVCNRNTSSGITISQWGK